LKSATDQLRLDNGRYCGPKDFFGEAQQFGSNRRRSRRVTDRLDPSKMTDAVEKVPDKMGVALDLSI
jgi:hypothetical protein